MAAAWLINATEDNPNYQLHGAVVFTRTGERTPELDSSGPRQLTALGAQQLYAVGEAFRGRYINSLNGITGLGQQPIIDISANVVDNDQTYVLAADEPYLVASAQAFMQGLYPPFTLNKTAAIMLDPSYILANGSYIEYPLDGYQYAQVHTASDLDPTSIWVEGSENCVNAALSGNEYYDSPEFSATRASSQSLYQAVGMSTLGDVLTQPQWDYYNAYVIYDYLNYQYAHDTSIFALLSDNISYAGAYDELRWLADQQEWALYGNISADSGIRTIAGKTLAARVLGQFQEIIGSMGSSPKLTLLFGEHEPFLSFFALTELQFLNSNFFGLPEYGSSMVFEMYSIGNDSTFPTNEADLWIRFHFHNGTDFPANGSLQAFPIFGRGPSQTDMPWLDFQDMMSRIMTSVVMDWCNQCAAQTLFCDAFIQPIVINPTKDSGNMTPQIAGVIGAAVTLGVLAIAFILAMLVGGIRFHRVQRSKKGELGGFKGSAKLASDADLSLPKNGAVAGIVSMEDGDKKERVGSWELRNKETGKDIGGGHSRRPSLDEEEAAVSPFANPVRPDERV
ncbi:phosphoglycerate mutase-like protein [Lepidopterella palustris CBS 459.81]|uniref:Phosphoglycerate mutase-like protein n=1 Tax=Lepidopterella palustris CBS 459.81 TaxID=1314670 RepID=A0A8E2EAC7_9PEZI|nr:phosphoglycerate mutase-like protein [Lepidopterella palustris CBS 459.81]